MRRRLMVCMGLACCTPSAAMTLNAEVERLGADRYRLTAGFPYAVSPGEAQSALAPVAEQVCAGRAPTWGRYSFATNQPIERPAGAELSTSFEQDVNCGDAGSGTNAGTPAPRSPATDADRSAVEARTLEYLALKDSNEFATANALFADDVAVLFGREELEASRRAFNKAAGVPKARTIVGVTFYDDPVDAQSLGRYAAVDYRASYPDRAFYCGYAMWLLQPDGSYRMVRVEESTATDEDVGRAAEEVLSALKQQPGCREP